MVTPFALDTVAQGTQTLQVKSKSRFVRPLSAPQKPAIAAAAAGQRQVKSVRSQNPHGEILTECLARYQELNHGAALLST